MFKNLQAASQLKFHCSFFNYLLGCHQVLSFPIAATPTQWRGADTDPRVAQLCSLQSVLTNGTSVTICCSTLNQQFGRTSLIFLLSSAAPCLNSSLPSSFFPYLLSTIIPGNWSVWNKRLNETIFIRLQAQIPQPTLTFPPPVASPAHSPVEPSFYYIISPQLIPSTLEGQTDL